MKNIYEVRQSNEIKSFIVIAGFFLFAAFVIYILTQTFGIYMGYQPGGFGYLGIALTFSGISTFVSYYYSDKIVLSISGAKEADRKEYFDFYTVTENLAISQGLPKPKIYVIDDSAPNAFATGRDYDHAVICATSGLLDKMTRSELEAVLAHELSHIKNYDMRLMSIVSVMVGIIALMADWLLRVRYFGGGRKNSDNEGSIGAIILILGIIFAVVSPIIAQLIRLAISRRREFMADAGSVEITRQPNSMISALKKLESDTEPLEAANKATAHLYIVNPFRGNIKGAVSWFSGLFNTHPPIEDRIKALESMA
ncbi:MAG TPA: M48 family metallopeptidase [Patescibacteria group bacterium]|nr:M48 family metallopeptidase [Patescibacteria group bacterium]